MSRVKLTGARRIGIGTAQFGMPYGISNTSGQVSQQSAEHILRVAADAGIDTLDTAVSYGNAEAILGDIGVDAWKVVSKLPPVPSNCSDIGGWFEAAAASSLSRLRIAQFDTLLLHQTHQLRAPNGADIHAALVRLVTQGVTRRIGLSVYNPGELRSVWPSYSFDLVQAPLNVFDRRMGTSGMLESLRVAGVAVHARSLFLQGLLLMDRDQRPGLFNDHAGLWAAWDEWRRFHQLTAVAACVSLALSYHVHERVIVGVENAVQLREIIDAANHPVDLPPPELATEADALINPARWVIP